MPKPITWVVLVVLVLAVILLIVNMVNLRILRRDFRDSVRRDEAAEQKVSDLLAHRKSKEPDGDGDDGGICGWCRPPR
jgi:hypothetical protein